MNWWNYWMIGFGLLSSMDMLHAASVYRCEAQNGHVTFTQQGCSTSQTTQLQKPYNPTPGSGKAIPLAEAIPAKTSATKPKDTLIVVGQKDDGCGNTLTASARREAIVRQEVRPGMSREDIESALGKPDKTTNNNGRLRYSYKDREGSVRTISFDERGCVPKKP